MENAVMMSPHSVDTTHVSATPETKVTPRRKAKKFDIVNFLLPVFIGLYGISSVADTMIRPVQVGIVALSLGLLSIAILLGVIRVVRTAVRRNSIQRAILGNLPLFGLIVAWILKAISFSYYFTR